MFELESLKNSNQNIIKENALFKKKKIQRKKKRKFKNTKKPTIYFSDIFKPIPLSEETIRIKNEIRAEYPIKVEKIRQTYKEYCQENKEKVLEIIIELEELFYTALFEDLNTGLSKELAYLICMEYEINSQEIFPFYLYKNK